jgi:hypothetical protein
MKLNPNSEIRVPKEIRSSNTEAGRFVLQDRRIFGFAIGQYGHSDFGFRPSFGFRAFGLRISDSSILGI